VPPQRTHEQVPGIQRDSLLELPLARTPTAVLPNGEVQVICVQWTHKHPGPAVSRLHNGYRHTGQTSGLGWGFSNGELHPPDVKHQQPLPPICHPIEAAVGVLAPGEESQLCRRHRASEQIAPAPGWNGSPLSRARREDKGDQLGSALRHPDHAE
jgi:hypothetical protein